MRQLVDWGAVLWAGLVAGILFLGLDLFVLPRTVGGNAWVMLRLLASPVLGEDVLAPPATFDLTVAVVALVLHFALSFAVAALIAVILHRWGLFVGIFGGALIGLAVYCINFYTLSLFFPWFFAMSTWTMAIGHALFGAAAGGVYESLEVEVFVSE